MLRIIASRSSEQALSYYGVALSREDYYAGEAETAGKWGGEAARRLGLVGAVERGAFEALVQNQDPSTGEQLTPRQSADRRVGYDFNFHCPKSVSLVYAMTGDEQILTAFESCVRTTMQEIEADMQTRIRKDRQQDDRTTGNIAWAEFIHRTARPVGGVPDPHLHAHCFVFNATHDQVEDRWKAGQFGNIKRDAPYYEACFHARFAEQLRELGYNIERTRRGWEVAGIPRSVIEKFSQRTAQIGEAAKELGISDKAQIDRLGAMTREAKRKDLGMDELKEVWRERLTDEERQILRDVEVEKTLPHEPAEAISPLECINHAEAHLFERASVVPERRFLTEALWRGVGSINVEAMHKRFEESGFLRATHDGERVCTTMEILGEERSMVADVRGSRGSCRPLKVEEHEFVQANLSDEQKNAVRHILGSMDRVTGIRGGAGTGKTSLMREAITAIHGAGHEVFVFAPSAEASRGVLREEGFRNADTVARLLVDKELQEEIRGHVLWIDEAGLLGTRSMKRLLDLAREKEARVILAGDTRQHRSVERGDSLRLLQEQAGLACAELKTIFRQTGDYREAIEAIQDERIEAGFAKLDELGAIREMESHERYDELADEYVKAIAAGESVLVVSPTHREAELVTASVRESLRENGKLGSLEEERTVPSFRALGWTDAEKADPVNYHPRLYVEFQLNAKGFQKSEKWRIEEADDERVIVANRSGERKELPLRDAQRFEVMESSELKLAAGDRVHFRKNGKSLDGNRIHNGSVHEIEAFDDDGNMVLANGWKVPADFGHLGYGYVLTSHASQGKTVDHVLIAQGSDSWGASNREQFYVSASRGRKSVKIYTDSREELLEAVLGSSLRVSAMELDTQFRRRPEVQSVPLRERERILAPSMEIETEAKAKLDTHCAAELPREGNAPEPASLTPTDPPEQSTSLRDPDPPDIPPAPPSNAAQPRIGVGPNAPSIAEIARAQELLAKYAGRGVDSAAEPPKTDDRARALIEKYTGRRPDDPRNDELRKRDRDRSE